MTAHLRRQEPRDRQVAGLRASVSAGYSTGAAVSVDAVVEEADRRLYRAEERGRGRLVGA